MKARKVIVGMAAIFAAMSVQAKSGVEIRRNQVGYSPQQEKVIVVEGINPAGKLRVTTPDGKVVKPRQVRKAVSPWSGKTRYVVDLGNLTATGTYQVSVGKETCQLTVKEHPLHDVAEAALRLFYLIRSGVPIEQGGAYNRPLGHPDTHVLVHNSAASPLRPAGTVISSPSTAISRALSEVVLRPRTATRRMVLGWVQTSSRPIQSCIVRVLPPALRFGRKIVWWADFTA